MDEARIGKGWLRLVAVLCTLFLAGSVFLVLGMTVWAQEQPTEQPAGTEQPAETTQQPAQTGQTSQQDGLVIDYWEPQVGTRTVYYVNDYLNDEHGDYHDTAYLGYKDAAFLYSTTDPRVPVNYASTFYRSVEATSNMNACYFDLNGPWYFNMTTPFRIERDVLGINEAPDAVRFPQATYAVRERITGSGGHSETYIYYMTNDATAQEWRTWGYTVEYFPVGQTTSKKEIVEYTSPYDKDMQVYDYIRFPLSVGGTGTVEAISSSGGDLLPLGSIEIIAEGKITVPGETYDALLMKYDYTLPQTNNARRIEYYWFVKDIGVVAGVKSLPNILGPTYEEATGYYSVRRDKVWYNSQGMWVLKSFTTPGATE
ncbi:MAG: hypothetical protein AB1384_11020 [Actinomycetota bacterium]